MGNFESKRSDVTRDVSGQSDPAVEQSASDGPTTSANQSTQTALSVRYRIDPNNGDITLDWLNQAGVRLVRQKITPVDPNREHSGLLRNIREKLSCLDADQNVFRSLLEEVRNDPNLKIELQAQPAILRATAREIIELIDAEIYFVPPSKARDAKLGTLTGGSLLSTSTLPETEGNWALVSLDVVGLGRANPESGDHVLRALAPLVSKHFGDDVKLFARDGGDEFVFLLRVPSSGAREVVEHKMKEFKAELAEVREQAFSLSTERDTTRAVQTTLMRNAFRNDLDEWDKSCELGESSPTTKGFAEFMLERYPILKNESAISLEDWPRGRVQQEMRLQGILRELFGGSTSHMFYYKRAKELASRFNPLLDVRASVTLFSGEVSPERMQLARAQNNYEIDRLKNHPHAPVVISQMGLASDDPSKNFVQREGERLLVRAIASGDDVFRRSKERLLALAGAAGQEDEVFRIACELSRATCQDAQNPLGTRYSLGTHILEGHLHHLQPGQFLVLSAFKYDLKDTGRIQNRIGPEAYDDAARYCCEQALPEQADPAKIHSDRVGGGSFWQYSPSGLSLDQVARIRTKLLHAYTTKVTNTMNHELQRLEHDPTDRRTALARMEKHGLIVLDETLGRVPVVGSFHVDHKQFPAVDTSRPLEITVRAEQTRKETREAVESALS